MGGKKKSSSRSGNHCYDSIFTVTRVEYEGPVLFIFQDVKVTAQFLDLRSLVRGNSRLSLSARE